MKISQLIKQARKDAGLSQRKLADLLDISQVQIARYETGQVIPRPDRLEMIMKALGKEVSYSFK